MEFWLWTCTLWPRGGQIADLSAVASAKADCGSNREATTDHPQITKMDAERGTGGKTTGPSDLAKPPLGRLTVAPRREPGVDDAPRPPSSFLFFVAPTGRWTVATGGATPLSASRNPWERSYFSTSAPEGRGNAGTGYGSAEHISLIELDAVRPHHSQKFGPEARRPSGAKKGKKDDGLFCLIRFPRVARRAAARPRRSTRGYNPAPRRG